MVDIIPYTSDDEDQTNWVPLTSSVPNPTSSNATAAASSKEDTNNTKQSAMKVNSDIATSNDKEVSQDGIIFVDNVDNKENEEDDDQDWQTISSSSPPPTSQQHTTQPSTTTDAPSQEWSWGQQLITHLTTTTPSSTSELKVEYDNISDAEEEDNIVWSKPNAIQDDNIERIRVKRDEREQFGRKKMIEEEYTDIISSSIKQKNKKIVAPMKQQKQLPTVSVEEDIDEEEVVWQKPNTNEETTRQEQKKKKSSPSQQFKHIPSQSKPQHKTSTSHQKQPPDEQRSGQQTIKTKLQQTLIHDPLYALPFCFLKHLYYETKLHIIHTYNIYFEQHDLSHVLAPLLLLVLISLFGLTLIVLGLYNLGTLVVQGVVHGSVSFGTWLMNYSLSMAGTVVWWSICSLVLLGIGIWIWSKLNERKATNDKSSFHVPSISTMLPWTIALSSTAFYEAIVILFSLRIYLSVLTVDNSMGVEECVDEKDQYCLLPGASDQSTSSLSLISTCFLVLLLAVINALVVSVAANILDQNDTSQVVKANQAKTAFFKSYKQIQKHLPACHVFSIIILAVLSILTLLVQALYVHYLQEGGNVLYTLINQLGTVGYNTVCIGVGVLTLVTLWNVVMSSIATNDTILGISYGEISRNALKQSIVEISSRAVWSDKDVGSSLLGILSDDDGALRLAILEWIIDRWATSKKSEDKPGPSSSTTHPDDSSPPSATDESTDSDKSSQDKDSSTDPPSFQGQTKQSTEDSSSFTTPNNSGSTSSSQVLPSYQSLQAVIARLDADETLIPTIKRYRMWVYSLPPSRNAAVCVALWKLCPAIAIMLLWISITGIAQLCILFLSSLGVLSISSTGLFGLGRLGIVLTILSPILCIEYLRVRQWWAKTTCQLKKLEYDSQASTDGQTQRDLVMILLQSDSTDDYSESTTGTTFLFDTSSFLLRIWHLLEESISVLESSIPVVRSLTVASSVADLSTNAICLVDLALEVKKRGLLGGAGMMIYDAFTHHLSKEIQQRKQETASSSSTHHDRGSDDTEEEDLGGQYTASIMNAVGNVGKISHNVSCLIQKDEQEDCEEDSENVKRADETEGTEKPLPQPTNQDEDTSSEIEITHGKVEEVPKEVLDKDDPVRNKDDHIDPNQGEEEASSQEKSEDNEQSNDDDGVGLMPFLIGGGLAIAGTVAGIALQNNGQDDKDKRRRKESRS